MHLPLTLGSGHLLFMREGSLLAQAFDERNLEPRGDPIPVAERVGSAFLSANFSVSPSGVLAYRAGEALPWLSRLSWFDRQGKPLGNVGEPGAYSYADLALSPDGTHLAAARVDAKVAGGEPGIWLLDLLRGGAPASHLMWPRIPRRSGHRTAAEWHSSHRARAGLGFIRKLRMAPEKSKH